MSFAPYSTKLWQLYEARSSFLNAEIEALGDEDFPRVKCGNFNFIALVRQKLHLVCDLDILFLRRENPGALFGGGDLDNRIKVLFDALRIPDENEIRGMEPDSDEHNAFLCLTENDALITGFRVTTDRLLEPATSEARENDIRLIINVEVKATTLTEENMAYFSHF
jgi:hypothetical protein